MRRIIWTIIFFSLLIFVSLAQAETDWRPTNQGTLTWDPSVIMSDGVTPVHPLDTITYNVHIKKDDGTGQTQVATEVQCCSHVISFTGEGRYLAGLSTVRLATTGKVTESFIIWSDDPKYADVPFGYEYNFYALPAGGLAPQ